MPSVSLPDEVRAACAWVTERARHVRIVESEIDSALWNRGAAPRYKSSPRSRNAAY
jgi:hypothetical protein